MTIEPSTTATRAEAESNMSATATTGTPTKAPATPPAPAPAGSDRMTAGNPTALGSVAASNASGKRPVTRRGERTRARLLAAARQLLESDGYHDVSVAEIAKKAGVAHGTFYTYFDSKEDLFSAIVADLTASFFEATHDQPVLVTHSAVAQRVERVNRGYLTAYRRYAGMMAVLEQVATLNDSLAAIRRKNRSIWFERNVETLTNWQNEGLIDQDIDPEYAATAMAAMVDKSAFNWFVLQAPHDFDQAVEHLTRFYCRAIGAAYP